jgi:hypothetical protein
MQVYKKSREGMVDIQTRLARVTKWAQHWLFRQSTRQPVLSMTVACSHRRHTSTASILDLTERFEHICRCLPVCSQHDAPRGYTAVDIDVGEAVLFTHGAAETSDSPLSFLVRSQHRLHGDADGYGIEDRRPFGT